MNTPWQRQAADVIRSFLLVPKPLLVPAAHEINMALFRCKHCRADMDVIPYFVWRKVPDNETHLNSVCSRVGSDKVTLHPSQL